MANMIFQYTWQQVVDDLKTQTRRLVKPGEWFYFDGATIEGGQHRVYVGEELMPSLIYGVGKQYAVMPARGVRGIRKVADIEITGIKCEDVREISDEDVIAEGFQATHDFWDTWVEMHDKSYHDTFLYAADMGYLREYDFYARPAERYTAWCLDFRVKCVYPDAITRAREVLVV